MHQPSNLIATLQPRCEGGNLLHENYEQKKRRLVHFNKVSGENNSWI
jgi:hypothetical protein